MKNINGKVVLVFPIITELVDYALTIDITRCEIIRSRCLLIGDFTEAEIELAIEGYKATINR